MDSEHSDEQWDVRAARHQALFRAVNEKLKGDGSDASGGTKLTVACECADTACTERLEITPSEYEQMREHRHRFAVAAGHVYPEVEDVVAERDGFVVVEKRTPAARGVTSAV